MTLTVQLPDRHPRRSAPRLLAAAAVNVLDRSRQLLCVDSNWPEYEDSREMRSAVGRGWAEPGEIRGKDPTPTKSR